MKDKIEYVYIFTNKEHKQNRVKIGISNDIEKRLRQLIF